MGGVSESSQEGEVWGVPLDRTYDDVLFIFHSLFYTTREIKPYAILDSPIPYSNIKVSVA